MGELLTPITAKTPKQACINNAWTKLILHISANIIRQVTLVNETINLRGPRDRVGPSSVVRSRYFLSVLDRKLLERLMSPSPSPKSQVMFASAFSWIGDFFRIFGIHIFQVMASLWI